MLMDVQEIILPEDLGAVLNQLKTFALARGWTLDGDSDGVFQLRSSGFGNQAMIFRFKGQYTLTYAYHGLVEVIGVSPLTPAFSTSMTTGAFTSTGDYATISIRGTGAHKAWIVGNSNVLMLIQQNNEYSCTSLVVGSFDLFDTSRNDGFFAIHARWASYPYKWDTLTAGEYQVFVIPGVNLHVTSMYHTWLYGERRSGSAIKSNLIVSYGSSVEGVFDSLADALTNGSAMPYSGNRVIFQPTIYGYDSSASLWRPIGKLPWHYLKFDGLKPGETLDFGGDTYMAFPSMYIPHPFGWAVRVS